MSAAPTRRSSSSTLPAVSPGFAKNVGLSRRPWRRHVLEWERLAHEKWEGEGTEEKPYIVGWMTDDPENPRTWKRSEKCKCFPSATSERISLYPIL
jgi:hypothetical protein